MARRVIEVAIVGDADSLKRALGSAGREADNFGGRIDSAGGKTGRAGRAFAAVGRVGLVAGAALGGGLVLGARAAINEFQEAERVTAQTNNVLRSTRGVANLTAAQITALADTISRKTGIDDEAVQSSENLLLTFTKVRDEAGRGNDIFSQAIPLIADMSVALGTDLNGATLQVGKALNDPIKGLTALSRAGVSFTQEQKDQVKAMVEAGDVMGAQKLILRELETQFGGSAEAAGSTFEGSINKAKVAVGNLAEVIGARLVPFLTTVITAIAGFVAEMQAGEGAGGRFRNTIVAVAGALRSAFATAIEAVRGFIRRHRDDLEALGRAFQTIGQIIAFVFENVVLPVARRVWPAIQNIVEGALRAIGGVIDLFAGIFTGDFGRMWDGIKAIFSGALEYLFGLLRAFTAPARELASRIGQAIVAGLRSIGSLLGDAASWLFNTFRNAVQSYLSGYANIGRFVLDKLRDGIKSAGDFIGDAASWLAGRWSAAVRAQIEVVSNVGRFITDTVRDGIKSAGDFLGDAASWLAASFVRGIRALSDGPFAVGAWIVDKIRDGIKAAGELLSDAARWLKDTLVNAVKRFLGINSPSKVFAEIGGHLIEGLVKGMDFGDAKRFIAHNLGGMARFAAQLVKAGVVNPIDAIIGGGGDAIGNVGELVRSQTRKVAEAFASRFDLRITSGYRTPEQNRAAGGVPNSRHTRGTPSNPGAWDLVGSEASMQAAASAARRAGLPEVLVHDAGSGRHLHLGFFKHGGFARGLAVVGEAGPEIVDFGRRGAQVYSNRDSREMAAAGHGGHTFNVTVNNMGRALTPQQLTSRLAFKIATASA